MGMGNRIQKIMNYKNLFLQALDLLREIEKNMSGGYNRELRTRLRAFIDNAGLSFPLGKNSK